MASRPSLTNEELLKQIQAMLGGSDDDPQKVFLKEMLLGSLAIAGVYLIYQFQKFFGLGIAFGLAAAILSSVFTVLNKRIASKYPARTTGPKSACSVQPGRSPTIPTIDWRTGSLGSWPGEGTW